MRWMGSIRYDVGILMAIMANNRRHASLYLDGHKMEDDYTLFLVQNSQTGGSLLPLDARKKLVLSTSLLKLHWPTDSPNE